MNEKDKQLINTAYEDTLKHLLVVAENADPNRTQVTKADLALIMMGEFRRGRSKIQAFSDILDKTAFKVAATTLIIMLWSRTIFDVWKIWEMMSR